MLSKYKSKQSILQNKSVRYTCTHDIIFVRGMVNCTSFSSTVLVSKIILFKNSKLLLYPLRYYDNAEVHQKVYTPTQERIMYWQRDFAFNLFNKGNLKITNEVH